MESSIMMTFVKWTEPTFTNPNSKTLIEKYVEAIHKVVKYSEEINCKFNKNEVLL